MRSSSPIHTARARTEQPSLVPYGQEKHSDTHQRALTMAYPSLHGEENAYIIYVCILKVTQFQKTEGCSLASVT